MTWRAKYLLPALSVLALLGSCKKNSNVGLSDDNVSVNYTDTFSVETQTISRDSVITSGVGSVLLGHQDSDIFGTTHASAYLSLKLSADSFDLGNDPQLDKAVFYIEPAAKFGDETVLNFDVYELDEEIDGTAYYSTDSIPRGSKVVSASFSSMPLNEQSEILLSQGYGEKLLGLVGNTSQEAFIQSAKGLVLVPKKDFNTVYKFNLASISDSARNFVRLFYTFDVDGNRESAFYDVYLDETQPYFTGINENLSGSELSPLTNSETLANAGYLKGVTGKRFAFRFPGLSDFQNINGRLVVNMAEIRFKIENEEQYHPETMILKSLDDDLNEQNLQTGAFYDEEEDEYFAIGSLLAEEIRYQAENDLNLNYVFATDETDGITQLKVDTGSIKLKVYYSEIE